MPIRKVMVKCTKAVGEAFKAGQYYTAHMREGIVVKNRVGESYPLTAAQKHISEAGEYWFIAA